MPHMQFSKKPRRVHYKLGKVSPNKKYCFLVPLNQATSRTISEEQQIRGKCPNGHKTRSNGFPRGETKPCATFSGKIAGEENPAKCPDGRKTGPNGLPRGNQTTRREFSGKTPQRKPSKMLSLAEWSKALASGASPQGRGFEPHSCHFEWANKG